MNHLIENFGTLASTPLRADALSIAEAGLRALDTEKALKAAITVVDNTMTVMGKQFDLASYRHIFIIGFGKVSCRGAYVLERMLKNRVKGGAVVGIKEVTCNVVDTYAGTHPMPSHVNFTATKHIEEIARQAGEDDLVLVVVSGGGSALLCSSLNECDQGQRLYEAFLHSGGTIEELNTVRKHTSALKGGGLAKALYPATVISLIFSDVPGGDIASIASGPTCLDETTAADAEQIITKYSLGSYRLTETPKEEKYFERIHNLLVASNLTALRAMQEAALALGYSATVASATRYADAEQTLSELAAERASYNAICMGGETKLRVPKGATGIGGRNTHLALCALSALKDGEVFLSFASDGHDNGSAAGAIVDRETAQVAKSRGLDVQSYTDAFDSFSFFEKTGGLIFTGALESNVADLMLLLSRKAV